MFVIKMATNHMERFGAVLFLTLFCTTLVECIGRVQFHNERGLHHGSGLSNSDLRELAAMKKERLFDKLLAPIMVPRVVGTASHEAVREHLASTMRKLGWSVEESSFDDATPHGRKRFTNVIATLDPKSPRHLVLACHYDSKFFSNGDFIGATDSAVPCAMLLHLAAVMDELFKKHQKSKANVSIQLLFLDGEEAFEQWTSTDSIYGARHHANKIFEQPFSPDGVSSYRQIHRMDLFVLLDLLGTRGPKIFNYFDEDSGEWFERLRDWEYRFHKNNLAMPMEKIFYKRPLRVGIEDDHIPFLRKGVPIMHLIPVPFPTQWHKHSDDYAALHGPTIVNLNMFMRAFVADYLDLMPKQLA